MKKTLPALAGLTGLALALSGCSIPPLMEETAAADDTASTAAADTSTVDDADSARVADGSEAFVIGTGGQVDSSDVTAIIPASLLEVLGSTAYGLPVDSLRFTPRDLGSLKYCGADVTIEYAEGGPGAILTDPMTDEVMADQVAISQADFAWTTSRGDESVTTLDDVKAYLSSAARADRASALMSKYGVTTVGAAVDADYAAIETYWAEVQTTVNAASSDQYRVGQALGVSNYPLSELDKADPQMGLYLAADFTAGTLVTECAMYAGEVDSAFELNLPIINTYEAGDSVDQKRGYDWASPFATVSVTVMVDGTLTISGGILSYVADANGNWVSQ